MTTLSICWKAVAFTGLYFLISALVVGFLYFISICITSNKKILNIIGYSILFLLAVFLLICMYKLASMKL